MVNVSNSLLAPERTVTLRLPGFVVVATFVEAAGVVPAFVPPAGDAPGAPPALGVAAGGAVGIISESFSSGVPRTNITPIIIMPQRAKTLPGAAFFNVKLAASEIFPSIVLPPPPPDSLPVPPSPYRTPRQNSLYPKTMQTTPVAMMESRNKVT
jgi:hypothetical protein